MKKMPACTCQGNELYSNHWLVSLVVVIPWDLIITLAEFQHTGPRHRRRRHDHRTGANVFKGNGSRSCWSFLTLSLTSWSWPVIVFIISISCAMCKLWPASRVRGPGDRRAGGSERPCLGFS